MDGLKLKDLNASWGLCLTRLGNEERARLPDRLTYARAERLKRLYSKLCNYMSADPDNDPGQAWPKQTQLAEALGWSERDVRVYMRMLEALGHPVKRLYHRSFGPVRLGHMKAGAFRRLTPAEITALKALDV